MNAMIPAQELKRRGISVVDPELANGPVHIILHNKPSYVVISESSYNDMMNDLADARLAASELDLTSGRLRRGNSEQLMEELLSSDE
ncbi:MAG: prevent-host-death protein [Planctomycetes bacterium]|nr:prevent-host-death protein [Planctomycetota bacterium]